jgi:hypothetical protein
VTQLSEDAIKLIKEQCDELLKQERGTLEELNFYKWLLRAFFVVVLGGSIFGILKIQDYVDDRVAKRVEKQDNLYSGAVLDAAGYPRSALEKFESFLISVNKNASGEGGTPIVTLPVPTGNRSTGDRWLDLAKISPEQRNFLVLSMLGALSEIEDKDDVNGGEFVGKSDWAALLTDPVFRTEMVNSSYWENNLRFNIYMGMGYLRYGDDRANFETARSYFLRANKAAVKKSDLRGNSFYIAMINYVLGGEKKHAVDALNDMIDWKKQLLSFRYYQPSDMLTTLDWNILERVWGKLGKRDFSSEIVAIFYAAEDKHNDDLRKQRVETFFDSEQKRNDFEKFAMDQYSQLQAAWKQRDAVTLQKITAPQLSAALSGRILRDLAGTITIDQNPISSAQIFDVRFGAVAANSVGAVAANSEPGLRCA